ncbi:MAG: hypothetical protein PHW12_07510, partial [Smithella sp.]|nr:hypothetical protein [Smithella sp.]
RLDENVVIVNVTETDTYFLLRGKVEYFSNVAVMALLATGEWQIIGGPEPNTIQGNQREEIDYFDLLQVGDLILKNNKVAFCICSKDDNRLSFTGVVYWSKNEVNFLFKYGSWYNITGLEEQGPSPAEMKEQYIELLKKYNEAEIARHNFREKIVDAWANNIVQVWESAPLAATEPGGPLLYDIDSLVIE